MLCVHSRAVGGLCVGGCPSLPLPVQREPAGGCVGVRNRGQAPKVSGEEREKLPTSPRTLLLSFSLSQRCDDMTTALVPQ